MIKPINVNTNSVCAFKEHKEESKSNYNDPLLCWPLRGAAFTNEVGEAMRPLIGSAATLSWAPALLYIGADVYDKYKNDQTEYSPSSKRALKQAIFQGMASVAIPVVAVKAGQNLLSVVGLASKNKITLNTQEHIVNLAQDFVSNGKMNRYASDNKKCKEEFLSTVSNNMDLSEKKSVKLNYMKNKKNIMAFSEKTIEEMMELRNNLLNPTEEFKSNNKWYKKYNQSLGVGQTENVAVKSTLNKYLKNKTLSGKFIKTIGGFLALGFSINPIDRFVEEILIGKVVGPKLDKKPSIEKESTKEDIINDNENENIKQENAK